MAPWRLAVIAPTGRRRIFQALAILVDRRARRAWALPLRRRGAITELPPAKTVSARGAI